MTYVIAENENGTDLTGLERIIFYADILKSTGEKTYDIRLKTVYPVPVGNITPVSELPDPSALANNPVRVSGAWIGGGFLNLNLVFFTREDSKVEHKFSLVERSFENGKDTLFLQLYHDAGGEFWDGEDDLSVTGLTPNGTYQSFPITPFIPKTGDPRPLKLLYTWHSYEDGNIIPQTQLYPMKGEPD